MPRKNGKKAVEGVARVEWGWITLDWAETMALKSGQKNVGLTLFLYRSQTSSVSSRLGEVRRCGNILSRNLNY